MCIFAAVKNTEPMIIVDKPFASYFLKNTLIENQFPVLQTPIAKELLGEGNYRFLPEKEAVEYIRNSDGKCVYTSSENSIHWISKHLAFSHLPGMINQFKNKVAFRKLIQPMFADFFFRELTLSDMINLDINTLPFPVIVKPAVGFFSMGVYKVRNQSDWQQVLQRIEKDIEGVKSLYPKEVLDASSFIMEEMVEGREFAFDTYFDEAGNPTIVGILEHIFGSDDDVSDRVYFTSQKIITENLSRLYAFIEEVGKRAAIKNFAMHTEVRVDANGRVVPIEINPMRFGGWCSSPDLTWHAFGFNAIEAYCKRLQPDWEKLFNALGDDIASIIILDNSTGYAEKDIALFDYEKLRKSFRHIYEIREVNYHEYPVFGFVFARSKPAEFEEVEHLLKSDLREFVMLKD
jgi:hypothetical protein